MHTLRVRGAVPQCEWGYQSAAAFVLALALAALQQPTAKSPHNLPNAVGLCRVSQFGESSQGAVPIGAVLFSFVVCFGRARFDSFVPAEHYGRRVGVVCAVSDRQIVEARDVSVDADGAVVAM